MAVDSKESFEEICALDDFEPSQSIVKAKTSVSNTPTGPDRPYFRIQRPCYAWNTRNSCRIRLISYFISPPPVVLLAIGSMSPFPSPVWPPIPVLPPPLASNPSNAPPFSGSGGGAALLARSTCESYGECCVSNRVMWLSPCPALPQRGNV